MEMLKEDLMEAINNGDWDKFSVLMDSSQEGIRELSQILEKKDLEGIWQNIKAKCSEILLDSASDDFFKVIKSVVLFALKTVQLKFDDQNYFDTISLLCNTLLSPRDKADVGDDNDEELKSLISSVCETLWKESVTGSDELMPCVVRHLLGKCLDAKPKMTLMTRLHSVRDSIHLVDFESEEGMTFRNLLLEVVSSGNLLKNDKGRKILVVVFSLNVEIAREVHEALKSMVPTATKSTLPWIAQAYMSTWKAAKERNSPELIECIELDCIGDIIYTALHSPRDGGLKSQFVQFFKVLSHFHKEKKLRNVASMLCRLYAGVLFRCFKATNGMVRANAMFVLSDVFPLCDLDKGREVNEKLLHEQLKVVEDLMDDPNTKVRQAAVSGLFTILGSYWELVPVDKMKNFLETILRTSAWDASSFEVRLCVVRGFVVLLDNCLAYPTLKKILPTLTNLFHDLNEKVRIAMVDLLLKVNELRDLKFWQVVPMEHLLARLEEDSLPVVKKLVKLLTDTYAPPASSLPSQMNRCIKLFSANRTAARKFYFQLAHSLDVNYGCKFVVYILEKLSTHIQNADASNNSLQSGQFEMEDVSMQGEEQQSVSAASFDNADVVTYLCEAVFLLLAGMKKSLKEPPNERTAKVVAKQVAKLIPNLIRRYKDQHPITNPLLLVCGRYNSKIFPTLSCSIISKVSSLPEPSLDLFKLRSRSAELEARSEEDSVGRMDVLLEVACRWKKILEMLNLIAEWVLPALEEPQPRRSSARRVNFREPSTSKPMLGTLLFKSMLQNKTCRRVVVSAHIDQLCEIHLVFKRALVAIENRLTSNDVRPFPGPLLVEALRAYLIIEVLLNKAKNDPDKLDSSLEEIYGWCSNLLTIPRRRSRQSRKRKRTQSEASNQSLRAASSPTTTTTTTTSSPTTTTTSSSPTTTTTTSSPTTTTTTMFTNNQENKDVDNMLLRGVLEVITKMTHNFLKLDVLNSNAIATAVDVCSAILKSDLFIFEEGGDLFSNVLDLAMAFSDEHKPAAVVLMTNIVSSLEMVLKKGLSKREKSKVLIVMLKVHDLTVDHSCVEFQPVIEIFVSMAVKAAVDIFKEGNVISTRDSEDNERLEQGQDTDSGAVHRGPQRHGKPSFLCLLLEVMNHKRVKTEFILAKFLKLCEEVNESGQIENIAGLLASVSCLARIQKCVGDTLSKCCQSLVSKCDKILENLGVDVDGKQAVIMRWLAEEKSWVNETFLNRSVIIN